MGCVAVPQFTIAHYELTTMVVVVIKIYLSLYYYYDSGHLGVTSGARLFSIAAKRKAADTRRRPRCLGRNVIT